MEHVLAREIPALRATVEALVAGIGVLYFGVNVGTVVRHCPLLKY